MNAGLLLAMRPLAVAALGAKAPAPDARSARGSTGAG